VQIVGPDFFLGLGAVDPDVGGAGIAPVVQQHAKTAGRDLFRQRHELVVRAPAARDQYHPGATVAHDLVNDIHAANVLDRHPRLHYYGGQYYTFPGCGAARSGAPLIRDRSGLSAHNDPGSAAHHCVLRCAREKSLTAAARL
jgi:hypothetical protein